MKSLHNNPIDQWNAILKEHHSSDIGSNIASLELFNKVLADMIEAPAQGRVKMGEFQSAAQTLAVKIQFTCSSIILVAKGTKLTSFKDKNIQIDIIDNHSINTLLRSIIEAYTTIYYLYNNKISDDEKKFRYKLWEVSGLLARQNVVTDDPALLKRQQEEKIKIDAILKEVAAMPLYSKLTPKQKDNLKKFGVARVISWDRMISTSDLPKTIFTNSYKLYSNYAHSEYLSVLQISQTSVNAKDGYNIQSVVLNLVLAKILIARTISFYKASFTSSKLVYNTLPDDVLIALNLFIGMT